MKKLTILVALSLLINTIPIGAFEPFKQTKNNLDVTVVDTGQMPYSDFLANLGIAWHECAPIGLDLLSSSHYPITLDIINNSTQSYRLGLSSVLAKCVIDYKQINTLISSLSPWQQLKVIGGLMSIMGGAFFTPIGVAGFALGRNRRIQEEGLKFMLSGLIASGLGGLLLSNFYKNVELKSKELNKYYVQPDDIIIKPGQRVRKLIFLTPQGRSQFNFMVSLVNSANPGDIVSFNVPIR
jgi:hypothetical protein